MASNSRISLGYTIIDAFTKTVFTGNPAAVILLNDLVLPDATLQLIAREFNLSQTAFLTPVPIPSTNDTEPGHSLARYSLRWFTSNVEVPLCGHATIASASVLFDGPCANFRTIEFETLSGTLTTRRLDGGRIEVELLGRETRELDPGPGFEQQSGVLGVLCAALGVGEDVVKFIGGGKAPYTIYLLVEIDGAVDLEALKVDTSQLSKLTSYANVTITCASPNPKYDFLCRTFAPLFGIPEDPVCGSANCLLAPYWTDKKGVSEGTELLGRQVSARGGDVGVVWDRERGVSKLRGWTAVTARGEIYVDAPGGSK